MECPIKKRYMERLVSASLGSSILLVLLNIKKIICCDLKTRQYFQSLMPFSPQAIKRSIGPLTLLGNQILGLGKCRSRDFDAQMVPTSLCRIRYNLLSVAKRFESHGGRRESGLDS